MSLEQAIARNRQRWADKRAGIKPPEPSLKAYRIRVRTIPPIIDMMIQGTQPTTEVRTVYGASREDAKERNGIQ